MDETTEDTRWERKRFGALKSEVLRADDDDDDCDEYGAMGGMKGRGKREISVKTRRPTASSGKIPTCENPRVNRPGIEPGACLNNCGPIVVAAEKNKSLKSTSPPNEFAKYSKLRNASRRHSQVAQLSAAGVSQQPSYVKIPVIKHFIYRLFARGVLVPVWEADMRCVSTPGHAACARSRGNMEKIADVETTRLPPRRNRFDSRRGDSSDILKWESCRTISLFGGFSQISPPPTLLHSGAAPYSPHFTRIGSQELDVKSRPNLFTRSLKYFSYCVWKPMRVTEVNMERRRNEGAAETGDPRENPPTNGIARHDSHFRKCSYPYIAKFVTVPLPKAVEVKTSAGRVGSLQRLCRQEVKTQKQVLGPRAFPLHVERSGRRAFENKTPGSRSSNIEERAIIQPVSRRLVKYYRL
ncbi:hypothetical protein PR048_030595 [Dryococelus australis]|uniref:Uncharacterized protein n=1 Tax=Dryococelus australis TaxID=614101 RepID=A0ABQ9G9E2_9NEOP|nr:hypothetical protein PR048_030595 [Dryococelus australis]